MAMKMFFAKVAPCVSEIVLENIPNELDAVRGNVITECIILTVVHSSMQAALES